MKIAVCIKAVPDTETKIVIASDNKHIETAGVKYIVSPYDEFAIEEAVKLREKHGGEITGFSLGGAEVTEVLKNALARGLDRAVHLQDDLFADLNPLATAYVLAAALAGQDFKIILCGQQGVGGDNNQVPAMVAQFLNLPQVTVIVRLDINGEEFTAEREIEGAHEIIKGTLPAVFSAQKDLNTPRYPSIKDIMAAKRKEAASQNVNTLEIGFQILGEIAVQNASSLGIQETGKELLMKMNSLLVLQELTLPPPRPQGRKIEGDPDEQVKTLVQLLRTEAKVI